MVAVENGVAHVISHGLRGRRGGRLRCRPSSATAGRTRWRRPGWKEGRRRGVLERVDEEDGVNVLHEAEELEESLE